MFTKRCFLGIFRIAPGDFLPRTCQKITRAIFPLFLADCVPASPLAWAECADLEAEFLGMWFFKECHNQPQDGASDCDLQFLRNCAFACPLMRTKIIYAETEVSGNVFLLRSVIIRRTNGAPDYDVQFLAKLPIYVSAYADEICKFRN